MAIPMAFEIGSVIRYIKPLRVVNMFSALAYNCILIFSMLDLMFGLYWEDKDNFDDSE